MKSITVTSYYLPPGDRIGAGVQMHMLANAYVDLGFDVSVVSPQSRSEFGAKYRLIQAPITGANKILKWSIELSRHRYNRGLVHFGGDNHLVRRSSESVHMRTFLGSCFAESKVSTNLKDKVRMGYLGVTELLGQLNADVSTAISADTNKYFPKPNIVVPCGVNLNKFQPGNEKSVNPSILFVGMIDSRKRGRLLLEAYTNEVRRRFPASELWIVRDNQAINLPGVRVFGSVSEEELIRLYQQCWCFCLPSSYEGFGVPYIEAMACGAPVVCTPNAGAVEVLENGTYGLMSDSKKLGANIVRLLGDEDLRQRYSTNGLEYVQKFDIAKVAQQYIQLAEVTGKL
jgi:phosphatidylinositol alpha-mannosyltransferase